MSYIGRLLSAINLSSRTLRQQMRYLHAEKPTGCSFCQLANEPSSPHARKQILQRTQHFFVADNLYGYALWDGSPVEEHLLLVPNRHIDTISALDYEELAEWSQLARDYERRGYSLYARAAQNKAKSISHQHAHLVRVGDRPTHLRLTRHIARIIFSKN